MESFDDSIGTYGIYANGKKQTWKFKIARKVPKTCTRPFAISSRDRGYP